MRFLTCKEPASLETHYDGLVVELKVETRISAGEEEVVFDVRSDYGEYYGAVHTVASLNLTPDEARTVARRLLAFADAVDA